MRAALVALALTLVPSRAWAQAAPPAAYQSVQLSLRTLGWAIPLGSVSQSGDTLASNMRGAFPMMLDLGGKITTRFFIGAYLGFNVGLVGSAYQPRCQGGVTCHANNVRVGLQAQLHLAPAHRLNPWFGLGIGTEATTLTSEAGSGVATTTPTGTTSYQGFELLHASFGVDYRATEIVGFGPYALVTLGRYQTSTERSNAGANRTYAIDSPANHGWLMLGVRGVLFP